MGEHIVNGQFKSDKYEWCPAGFLPLKVGDPMATDLLVEYARRRRSVDPEFSDDLLTALTGLTVPDEYLPQHAVLSERWRQVDSEGWTSEHDDGHTDFQLSRAAACYATGTLLHKANGRKVWPWSKEWWKPGLRWRNLEKAGALILAEMARVRREESDG